MHDIRKNVLFHKKIIVKLLSKDQICSNTRVNTSSNRFQHKSTRVRHKSTGVNTCLTKVKLVRHKSLAVNTFYLFMFFFYMSYSSYTDLILCDFMVIVYLVLSISFSLSCHVNFAVGGTF